jgi:hypothetical protein
VKSALEQFNHQTFAAQLNTDFLVLTAPQRVAVRLVKVTEQNSSPRLEQFSLLFEGPAEQAFGQGVFALQHDQLGEFELFLVPIGAEGGKRQYEAVFNRFRPAAATTPAQPQ